MKILGISAYFHDSAAALFVENTIVAAAPEERFSRIKHDNTFPSRACTYCLKEAKLSINDVDAVIFYEKPFVKFERILETHIRYAPRTFGSFLRSMPIWLKERLNLKRTIRKELKNTFGSDFKMPNVLFSSHHLSHAASAFYTSGFDKSAILVIDAVGEWATTSLLYADEKGIVPLKQQNFPHSIGMLYSAFTYFLGFKVNSDEYKVMGLAPYGNAQKSKYYCDIIKTYLVKTNTDACPTLNLNYFCHQYGEKIINDEKWEKLFSVKRRHTDETLCQIHKDLALAIQNVVEEIVLDIVKYLHKLTNCQNICIVGGTALNCTMNGKVERSKIFKNVFIPFAPGDSGAAIGACLSFAKKHVSLQPYLGPEYCDIDIKEYLKHCNIRFVECHDYTELNKLVINDIEHGKVVGWFQKRMEFGPRALGNRSVLCDAKNPESKDIINQRIKFRESFRPFAPVILEEDFSAFFDMEKASPYMSKTYSCIDDSLPATTHVDGSSRVQTVNKKDNTILYHLLLDYKHITGCPVLLNTSLNVMGDPIACSPKDAIDTYLKSGIDVMALGLIYISKDHGIY